jgi:hypothetical protein
MKAPGSWTNGDDVVREEGHRVADGSKGAVARARVSPKKKAPRSWTDGDDIAREEDHGVTDSGEGAVARARVLPEKKAPGSRTDGDDVARENGPEVTVGARQGEGTVVRARKGGAREEERWRCGGRKFWQRFGVDLEGAKDLASLGASAEYM